MVNFTVATILCMWLHSVFLIFFFFSSQLPEFSLYSDRLLTLTILFQCRRPERSSLSGHYLILSQFHNRKVHRFRLEYCIWFVFSAKWVWFFFFSVSLCSLPLVCLRSNQMNIRPYRCYHTHLKKTKYKKNPDTLMVPFTHVYTNTLMQSRTYNNLDLATTMNESRFPLYPLSVTVTIMIYVCLIL